MVSYREIPEIDQSAFSVLKMVISPTLVIKVFKNGRRVGFRGLLSHTDVSSTESPSSPQ